PSSLSPLPSAPHILLSALRPRALPSFPTRRSSDLMRSAPASRSSSPAFSRRAPRPPRLRTEDQDGIAAYDPFALERRARPPQHRRLSLSPLHRGVRCRDG